MDEPELKKLPRWVTEPYKHFLEQLIQLHSYYHLTMVGISMIIHRSERLELLTAELVQTAKKLDPSYREREEHKQVRENAKKEADLAREEADKGFPVLHQQSTVALWAALEAYVRRFMANWFANQPGGTRLDEIRKVKIRLVDYEEMSTEEKYDYLVGELERDLGVLFRQGPNRFEALFNLIGLSGRIEESTQRDLFELSQVRNVITHRRGIVDRRFADACPWMGVHSGDTLVVTSEAYHRYCDAVSNYETLIYARVKRYFGIPDRTERQPPGEIQA